MNGGFLRFTSVCGGLIEKYSLEPLRGPLSVIFKAAETKSVEIAVFGQFKAGKSSFLNSLIGRNLLSVGTIPVTSVITKIRHSEEDEMIVAFRSGEKVLADLAELDEYITETKNPGNRKQVDYVELGIPLFSGIGQVTLVDTPGTGSVNPLNTKETEEWLPEVKIALLLISAERPLSEADIALLNRLAASTPEIIIVLTKVDLFSEEETLQIEQYIRTSLSSIMGRTFPMFRYSTCSEEENYRRAITEEGIQPYFNLPSLEYERIIKHKIHSLALSALNYLDVSLKVNTTKELEREKLKQQVFDQRLTVQFISKELTLLASDFKGRTRQHILTAISKRLEGFETELAQKFNAEYDGWKGNLYKVTRKFESWLKINLEAKFRDILNSEYNILLKPLMDACDHYNFFIKVFRERLQGRVESVLGVSLSLRETKIGLPAIRKAPVSVSSTFDIHLDLLWFLFPMIIFKPVFKKRFMKEISPEIEKNMHRVTSELTEQMNKIIESMSAATLRAIKAEVTTLEGLLSGMSDLSAEVKQDIENLRALIKEVEPDSEQF